MQMTETVQNGVWIVSLSGRLDSTSSPNFEKQLLAGFDQSHSKLIIDCAELDYISSAGLRVILMAAKRMKTSGGQLALCGFKDTIREVFEISGFLNILTVCANREEALSAVA